MQTHVINWPHAPSSPCLAFSEMKGSGDRLLNHATISSRTALCPHHAQRQIESISQPPLSLNSRS